MKNWIISRYLYPKSASYQFFYQLNKHFLLWLGLIVLLLMSYPTYRYFTHHLTLQQLQQNELDLNETLKQRQKLLHSMQQHYHKKNQPELAFTEANRELKTLFERYQIQPETLQWQLEQEQTLYLTLNQKSQTLFNLLAELNQMNYLTAKEITLTKLYQHRLVQFNGIFVLTH